MDDKIDAVCRLNLDGSRGQSKIRERFGIKKPYDIGRLI